MKKVKKKKKRNNFRIDWQLLGGILGIAVLVGIALLGMPAQDRAIKSDVAPSGDAPLFVSDPVLAIPPFLTGIWSEEQSGAYPIAVSVDNLDEARPQSGLHEAPLVYETLAEGGITRFLAIFSSLDSVAKIGPVRSARPYFIDLASEHRAVFAHSGGSPEALERLQAGSDQLLNLDEFVWGNFFFRDRLRAAPHNLYTSTELLRNALKEKKPLDVRGLSPWLWSEVLEGAEEMKAAQVIKIPFSNRTGYTVTWKFDESKGVWTRRYNGNEHRAADGSLIETSTIIAQWTKMRVLDDVGRRSIAIVGSGKAIVFRDGVAIPARWEKTSRSVRTRFYNETDEEIAFAPGKVWIEIVNDGTEVFFE